MTSHQTDEEFFKNYCESADVVFNNGENEAIFIKDANLQICYLSPAYLEALREDGTVQLDKSTNETEIQKITTEIALVQDQEIRDTLCSKTTIYIDVYDRIGLIRKVPIINPSTNNFVGIIGFVKPYYMPNVLSTLYKINGVEIAKKEHSTNEVLSYELTERQSMVLFLYINKYSNAEISEILTTLGYPTSKTRINDHLKSLKFIFHVKSKEELITKALSLNYDLLIPRKLLQIGTYEIEDEIIIAGNK